MYTIDALISDLDSVEISAQKKAARILQDLSVEFPNKIQMLSKEVIKILLKILKTTDSASLLNSSLGLLCNLSAETEAQEILCEEETLNFLTSFLSASGDSKKMRRIVGILSNVMVDYSSKTIIGTAEVLEVLVKFLSSADNKLKDNAASALWKLMEQHYLNQAMFVEKKLDKEIPQIIEHNQSIATSSYYLKKMLQACSVFVHKDDVKFEEKIAATNLNEVFRGMWNNKEVAIKHPIATTMPEDVARDTLNEAMILKGLSHKNIIEFYRLIPNNALPVMIVLEYASGGSLHDYLHSSALIPWNTRLKIALALAEGLFYMHSQNVIHGDIKSLNVVLDREKNPKWCDFGFSELRKHALSTSQTLLLQQASSQVKGTLRWMSPELLMLGGKISRSSDVWAIAMVFFELASRRLPFSDSNESAVIKDWIINSEGESVPEICENSYAFFAQAMRDCWKKDPSKRLSSEGVVAALSLHIAA